MVTDIDLSPIAALQERNIAKLQEGIAEAGKCPWNELLTRIHSLQEDVKLLRQSLSVRTVINPPIQKLSSVPMATAAVHTTGDGLANYMLTGVDRNLDGIPDVLQTTSAFQVSNAKRLVAQAITDAPGIRGFGKSEIMRKAANDDCASPAGNANYVPDI